MTDNNFLIAQRIRAARLQRNLTQQDLAEKFNKTSAEYFYGEDFSDTDIQDIIALMRRLPPEMRKQQLPLMTMMLRMAEINNNMQNTDDKDKQLEAVKEFYEIFLSYYDSMEALIVQLREAKKNIESLLK
jgi:transcriptional regulator with XRE-family HTH domain